MSVRIVIGAQWGDEGKGKIVDLLSKDADYVIRYQGGANAGHTLKFDETSVVLHLVPSGIFHNNSKCVIGNGVVIDPSALVDEIESIEAMGINLEERLFISETAHVILPYHKVLDQVKEKRRGKDAIGTTGRGIGPAYVSKVSRTGIRMIDLLDEETLRYKVESNLEDINASMERIYEEDPLDADQIINEILEAAQTITPYITNTSALLHEAIDSNKTLLLEGAQGSMLDIDHGTYPYVTSSSPTAGGACSGSGIPPTSVDHVMGITKAYCTRVGNGPFPTELENIEGNKLRKKGSEFGATTGRPRRCGWIDLVALKYAIRINGINELTVTKMDVLDEFDEVKVCTDYQIGNETTRIYPLDLTKVEKAQPVYKSMKGWATSTRDCSNFNELPENAKEYLNFLEDYLGVKVKILSTGPKRSETIMI